MPESLINISRRRQFGRHVTGMAAMLLPYNESGGIDEDAYMALLVETAEAGLRPAVNMDTGYVNLLSPAERARVLEIAEQVMSGRPFVAGAYIEDRDGEPGALYRA